MKTERETWEALTSEYIRKVERSLAQVDHPRKKEVLEDLRDHLERRYADMPTDERTPEKFDEAIAEMDAPEEYAELLVNIGRAQVCRRVYGQGHRLKNMLGIVGDRLKGLLSEVRSRLSAGDREQADEISEQHDLIFADLTAFLSTLEPSPLELDLVDLRDLVDRALFTAGPATAKLAVEKHLAEVPEIVCDPASIHEAFLNILLNASEAMPDGGTLVVTLEQPDDDTVSVSFRDTGVGIEPGALGRIFQFGYSTKVFGSGLGLSQARESVRMHGGTLGVASEPGRGATFTVTLPSSPEIRPTLEDLTLRPVLFEDPQDLLVSFTEDEGLLIL